MNPLFSLSAIVAAGLMLSSCIESNAVYTLNPDGSGKVEHQVKVRRVLGNWNEEEPDKEMAKKLIRGSGGIVAWTDVSHRITERGNVIEFMGTGYFPSLSQVALGRYLDENGAVSQLPLPDLAWEPDESGQGSLTVRDSHSLKERGGVDSQSKAKDGGAKAGAGAGKKDSTVEDAAGSLLGVQFGLHSIYRCEIRIVGTLRDPVGLEIGADGKTAVFVHDPRLLSDADEARQNEIMTKIEEAGGLETVLEDGIFENKVLQSVLFDREPPFSVTVEASEASFDYEAEVAAADFKVDPPTKKDLEGWKPLKSLDEE